MKARNQIVNALLAGMILGGVATGTVVATPVDAAAETREAEDSSAEADDADKDEADKEKTAEVTETAAAGAGNSADTTAAKADTAAKGAEEGTEKSGSSGSADVETGTEEADSGSADTSKSESASASGGTSKSESTSKSEDGTSTSGSTSQSGSSSAAKSSDSGSSNSAKTETGTESEDKGSEKTETGKESGNSGSGRTETGKESEDSGSEKTETGKESGDKGSEKTETGKESGNSGSGKTETGKESDDTGSEKTETGKESGNSGSAKTETGTESGNTDSGKTETGAESGISDSAKTETGTESGSASGNSGSTKTETESNSGNSGSTKTETESNSGNSGSTKTETESNSGNTSSTTTETGTESGTSESNASGTSETPDPSSTSNTSGTNGNPLNQNKNQAKEAEKKSEEEQKKEEAEKKAEEEKKKAEEEAKKKAEEEKKKEEALKKAEEEKKKAEQGQEEGSGHPYSNRAYYSGSYFVTSIQRRLALKVGFEKVDKVYAMPAEGKSLNIYEGKSSDARVLGVVSDGGLLYILEDDGKGDWIYVESGEVRGYVNRKDIRTGKEVDALVLKSGEEEMALAEQKVDPLENEVYRDSLKTTMEINSILNELGSATVNRSAMIAFSKQFLGNPYVWGGESLTNGCDCSGFVRQIYAQFGISLPRTSYEMAEVGVKIPAEEAVPGDLLFYARNGVVYHVLMYIGDGKAINASSTSTGIVISNVNYNKVCWACRYIEDTESGEGNSALEVSSGTQASTLQAVGEMAGKGDESAKQVIIEALAKASLSEYSKYGFARSVVIAQAINETGWLAFPGNGAGIIATDNNVLGMNSDLNNSTWTSPWDGRSATRLVPQYRHGTFEYNFEEMRLYEDIESCMEDYAAFKIGTYPQLRGETDVDKVIGIGLQHYASDPAYQQKIKNLIEKYDLTKYDREYDTVFSENEEAAENAASAESAAENAASTESTAENTESPDSAAENAESPDSAADNTESTGSSVESTSAESASENADSTESTKAADSTSESKDSSAGDVELPDDEIDSEEETAESAAGAAANGSKSAKSAAGTATGTGRNAAKSAAADDTDYTEDQMNLIYAIVAEEDDTGYEGALAVISTAMNRADENFGGYGTNAIRQLTAEGQYAYSEDADADQSYKNRLEGNVPDFVKKAVDDCLKDGVRNTEKNTLSATSVKGAEKIGINWYYNTEAQNDDGAVENGVESDS